MAFWVWIVALPPELAAVPLLTTPDIAALRRKVSGKRVPGPVEMGTQREGDVATAGPIDRNAGFFGVPSKKKLEYIRVSVICRNFDR